jgi:hypothetical protein
LLIVSEKHAHRPHSVKTKNTQERADSDEADGEAARLKAIHRPPGAPPIDLIDGDRLCERGQAVAFDKGHLGGVGGRSVGACIVTHRGPASPKRHEPPHRDIANYWCTLIHEEPAKPVPSKRSILALAGLAALSFQWFNWNVQQNTAHTRSTSQNEHRGITAWINHKINTRINVYIHDTFAQNSSIQALLLTAIFIFYFAALSSAFVYARKLRRAKVIDEVEEKMREIRQQSGNQNGISTESTSSTSDPEDGKELSGSNPRGRRALPKPRTQPPGNSS